MNRRTPGGGARPSPGPNEAPPTLPCAARLRPEAGETGGRERKMKERALSEGEVAAMAEGMGHRVLPARLDKLTAGVNRLLGLCATLDAFDPGGAERAETLDYLRLKPKDLPAP